MTGLEKETINVAIDFIKPIRSNHPRLAYLILKNIEFFRKCSAKLYDGYLLTAKEVKKDKKDKVKRREYLKRLLDLLIGANILDASMPNIPYRKLDSTYPFISEHIQINKEIDCENVIYDKEKYNIPTEYLNGKLLDPSNKTIFIKSIFKKSLETHREAEKLHGRKLPKSLNIGCASIRGLYEEWLPTLTEEKIKNRDLLDNVLFCFTIKRALNGDEKAIDKLYSLYANTAIGIAHNMARKRKSYIYIQDIKQDATGLLRFLISGFRPEAIIDSLLSNSRNHIPIPLWIEKFYFWYLTEYVPKRIKEIMKGSSNDSDDGLSLSVLLNPYSPIKRSTYFKGTPKRIVKFNSFSFRPNKNTNLTVWLFGTKENFMQGRFYQILSETLQDYAYPKRELPHDFLDKEEDEDGQDIWVRRKVNESIPKKPPLRVNEETINRAIEELIRVGTSKRDAEIFIKHKIQKFKQIELAKEYSLSTRQIRTICKRLSLKYPIS